MKIENIKFKAKRLDGKGWIEGTPICINGKPYGIMIGEKESPDIDPSTVCQFTGLKDSNGVEIWEGDYISSIYSYPKQKKVEFKNGAFGLDTYYRGLDFLPFACCDIRVGCLIEFELEDRKEGEK